MAAAASGECHGRIAVVWLDAHGDLNTSGLVVLNDDKHLQTVDNIVPVIRTNKATPAVTAALNAVSAKLTTDALVQLNQMVSIDKADPSQVAQTWLSQNGLA